MDPDIAKMAILISAQFYKRKTWQISQQNRRILLQEYKIPTEVDDGAGKADVAAHWPLESLGPGQNPHLGVIASDVTYCTMMVEIIRKLKLYSLLCDVRIRPSVVMR